MRVQCICVVCGASFTRKPSAVGRYCSQACFKAPPAGIPQDDGTVLIPVTGGRFAVVDAADAPLVLRYRWHSHSGRYAAHTHTGGTKLLMHRLIMGKPPAEFDIDHIDRNGLNNRRSNLRSVTRSVNVRNTDTPAKTASGEKCVYRVKGRWRVLIGRCGRPTHVGYFDTIAEAVVARDAAIAADVLNH